MNTNENENGNSKIPEVEELIIDEGDDVETIKEKIEEYNLKVVERDDLIKKNNSQLYARTKKAEGFILVDGNWVKPAKEGKKEDEDGKQSELDKKSDEKTTDSQLSQRDLMTLVREDIAEEDEEEVINYAKFRNISVSDALKSDVLKSILKDRVEKRTTADATETGAKKRGNSKLTDESIMENASKKGELPSSDDDIRRLASLSLHKNRK